MLSVLFAENEDTSEDSALIDNYTNLVVISLLGDKTVTIVIEESMQGNQIVE